MSDQAKRIIFAGSPEFAVPSLRAVADSRHDLVAVLTQPDRRSGRGRKAKAGPVKQSALELSVPVLQPVTLKDSEAVASLSALRPDLLVVVAYGLLLPSTVLDLPKLGCVNVHASLLPRWRGASPIQAAVLAGDDQTGVSLMKLDAGLDTGPVYATANTDIGQEETAGELHNRLATLGAELLASHLDAILAGELKPTPQPATGITHAGRIDKADAVIDWQRSAVEIARQVRAYVPWPVAETLLDGQRLRVWSAKPGDSDTSTGSAGEVVAAEPEAVLVSTGRGTLQLTRVQMPGKQQIDAGDFANGYPLLGKVLGR